MMGRIREGLNSFINNRWLVFVAAMWLQSWGGIGYMFGSVSPVIKSSLNYNQKQLSRLGVAKDLGGSVGFLAGSLCEILPLWAALLIGATMNLFGYGWVWLIVTGKSPVLPLWAMCILIFVGSNSGTYFSTAALMSSVQNFPNSRGPVVGILKGFEGLSGAILTQIYTMINPSDPGSLIYMVAVGPMVVVISLMFFIRPVNGNRQVCPLDNSSFNFVYSVCLLLAAYLMGIMLVEDQMKLSHMVITVLTVGLCFLVIVPVVIPVSLSFFMHGSRNNPAEETLLLKPKNSEAARSEQEGSEEILCEVEDPILEEGERRKQIAQMQAQIAEDRVARVKRRQGLDRGEDFTLMEAITEANFWLIFFSLLLGSGSGLTVIDNLGQMSQSLGYDNSYVFVSMISIWNFLGRVGGGYLSEIVVRDYVYPRPVAMAVAQLVLAVGHIFIAFGWPGAMYIGTLLIGLGYGAHWAIVPATASELFGLKKFGILYNFFLLANPTGSFVFSGLIASYIYDHEAEKQHQHHYPHALHSSMLSIVLGAIEPMKCEGSVCFFLTSMIMSGFCIIACVLSMILVSRTKIVYNNLYGRSQTSLAHQ